MKRSGEWRCSVGKGPSMISQWQPQQNCFRSPVIASSSGSLWSNTARRKAWKDSGKDQGKETHRFWVSFELFYFLIHLMLIAQAIQEMFPGWPENFITYGCTAFLTGHLCMAADLCSLDRLPGGQQKLEFHGGDCLFGVLSTCARLGLLCAFVPCSQAVRPMAVVWTFLHGAFEAQQCFHS